MSSFNNLDGISNFEILSVSCACLSAFSSSLVVLTGTMFPSMMRSHFMRLIVMISALDFIGSFFNSFGFPTSNNQFCITQGFFGIFCFRGSLFYACSLNFELYSLAVYGKLFVKEYQIHALCFVINTFLQFIPYSTSTAYGQDDYAVGLIWCAFSGGTDDTFSENMWVLLVWMIPVLACTIFELLIFIRIKIHFSNMNNTPGSQKLISVVNTLILYPLAIILTWIPNCIVVFLAYFTDTNGILTASVIGTSQAIGVLYGTAIAIVFFSNSHEARQRWYVMLCRSKSLNNNNNNQDQVIVLDDCFDAELYDAIYLDNSMRPSCSADNQNNILTSIAIEITENRNKSTPKLMIELINTRANCKELAGDDPCSHRSSVLQNNQTQPNLLSGLSYVPTRVISNSEPWMFTHTVNSLHAVKSDVEFGVPSIQGDLCE